MKLETYSAEDLRAMVRRVEAENRSLRDLLRKHGIAAPLPQAEEMPRAEEPEADQGDLIRQRPIDERAVRFFAAMFLGRWDVYALRGRHGGYFPQCSVHRSPQCPHKHGERIACAKCPLHHWEAITLAVIWEHLLGRMPDGTDVCGVYPLLPDGTCHFLVFDFDCHSSPADTDYANKDEKWRDEVDALRRMCESCEVPVLVDRSRSGRGAHLWIFFSEAVPAALARTFGELLLEKGAQSIALPAFHFYDRMLPAQDSTDYLGSLIALPLQGQALREGNSAFIDEDWNAWPDQFGALVRASENKLSAEDLQKRVNQWTQELDGLPAGSAGALTRRPRPWRRDGKLHKEDVTGQVHLTLADGLYIDTLNLKPRLANAFRSMAVIDNPKFYKNRAAGRSNWREESTIYLGKDRDGYLRVPRGLLERVQEACAQAQIPVQVHQERESGRPIRVRFTGELYPQQRLAAEALLAHDDGILRAAPAFGKTVVCSSLIASRGVSTLVLMRSKTLVNQWKEELERFLEIDEEPPTYTTPTGRVKRMKSAIGTFQSGQHRLTGIIDIATIGSVYAQREELGEALGQYGMVLVDECHGAAADQARAILEQVRARYLYGVSATPERSDNLEKIVYLLLGPIRFSYSAQERTREQSLAGITHVVLPRYTHVVPTQPIEGNTQAHQLISHDELRNAMILADVREALAQGRTPVILTRLREHASALAAALAGAADHVYLLCGERSSRENEKTRQALRAVPAGESFVLCATGQMIGEGFDCPRLDTLMLAAPVSFFGRLLQYVGRVSRSAPGKREIVVYDYVDAHVPVLEHQYTKRLATYRKIGYRIRTREGGGVIHRQSIFDYATCPPAFDQDLIRADEEVVVASPGLRSERVDHFLQIIRDRQEAGVRFVVITLSPEETRTENPDVLHQLILQLREAGVTVHCTDQEDAHYAVIDHRLVWHGGIDLLGREDLAQDMIRVVDAQAAAELLEISAGRIREAQESAGETGEIQEEK